MNLKIDANSIWVGSFRNQSEATEFAKAENLTDKNVFDSTRWIARQLEMLQAVRNGSMPRFSNLPFLISLMFNSKNVRVVDIGGGSAWIYEYLMTMGQQPSKYTNLELQETCNEFAKYFVAEDKVEFMSSFEKLNQAYDILYSNSVIQYFQTLDEFFGLIDRTNPKFILLDDVQTSEGDDFWSLQRYYDSFILTKFYSVSNLIRDVKLLGYELTSQIHYPAAFSNSMDPSIGGRRQTDPNKSQPVSLFFKAKN